jgi:hypothetical protein
VRAVGKHAELKDRRSGDADTLPNVLFVLLGGTHSTPNAYTEILTSINMATDIDVLGLSYVWAPFAVSKLNEACGDPTFR